MKRPVHTSVTRRGWHEFYAARFNATQEPSAAHLALWYLLLHLAFDGEQQ